MLGVDFYQGSVRRRVPDGLEKWKGIRIRQKVSHMILRQKLSKERYIQDLWRNFDDKKCFYSTSCRKNGEYRMKIRFLTEFTMRF